MKTLFTMTVGALLSTSLLLACSKETKPGDVHASSSSSTTADMKDKAKDAMDSTKAAFEKAKSDFKTMADAKLASADKEIQKVKDKAAKATGADKVDLDKVVASLEQQRKAAGMKLGELQKATAEGWQSLTSQVDQAVKDLDMAARNALAEKK